MAEENNDGKPGEGENGSGGGPDYEALYKEALEKLEKSEKNSKKWESRSKANKEKADAYDEEHEKNASVEERLAKLEDENKALKADRAHAALVEKVAKATGLSVELVGMLSATDEEGLTEQAKSLSESMGSKGYPPVDDSGTHAPAGGMTPADVAKIKNPAERVRARAQLIHQGKAK